MISDGSDFLDEDFKVKGACLRSLGGVFKGGVLRHACAGVIIHNDDNNDYNNT